MPINREDNYIFVHIPKVAGTSIERALGIYGNHFEASEKIAFGLYEHNGVKYSLQHVAIRQLLQFKTITEKEVSQYFKFCFVRNPWDRAVSDYKWHKSVRKKDLSFRTYLKKCEEIVNEHKHKREITSFNSHYVPQSWFVFNDDMEKEVDFIGRYENLDVDLKKILEKIGIENVELRNDNKGKSIPYIFYYFDLRNIFLARKIYMDDIKLFKYHFFKSNSLKLFLKRLYSKIFSN